MLSMSELKKFVDITGTALMEEDAYLAGCFARHQSPLAAQPFGILWRVDERYYQVIALRRLLLYFPRPVAIERDSFDFNVWPNAQAAGYSDVGEMKRFMDPRGDADIPKICRDIHKIYDCGLPGFVILISANPPAETGANIDWLTGKLDDEWSAGRLKRRMEHRTEPFRFRSVDKNGDVEVWVLGMPVEATAMSAESTPSVSKDNTDNNDHSRRQRRRKSKLIV